MAAYAWDTFQLKRKKGGRKGIRQDKKMNSQFSNFVLYRRGSDQGLIVDQNVCTVLEDVAFPMDILH
jgi:hypothetical protein